jgi:hypothetical protein
MLVLASARAGSAQTLAPLAQEEAARRRAIATPARVIANPELATSRLSLIGVPQAPASRTSAGPPAARRVPFAPAVYQDGVLPQTPVQAVSGGEVVVEASIGTDGRVASVKVLRDTPPFTGAIVTAVQGWQFTPAEDADAPAPGEPVRPESRRPVESKVLIVGLFRPPALFPMTLGQPPADLAGPSDEVPAAAALPAVPLLPPQALFGGIVLAELRVGEEGVATPRIVRATAGLDLPTLDALRALSFRPARVHDLATPTLVYVVAAYRQPIIQ